MKPTRAALAIMQWLRAPASGGQAFKGRFHSLAFAATKRAGWLPVLFIALQGVEGMAADPTGDRPGLLFREDWKETPAALPVTQEHVAHPDLLMTRHGPGGARIKKSHHDKPIDDPFYIWSGEADSNWALSLRHSNLLIDLTGGKIRWRSKQSGFRELRIMVKLANGRWLVSDQSDGQSADWRVREFNLADVRWRVLDIERVTEGGWVVNFDLSRVEEIGFTDLMVGGRTAASSRLDWIEVYARGVPR